MFLRHLPYTELTYKTVNVTLIENYFRDISMIYKRYLNPVN